MTSQQPMQSVSASATGILPNSSTIKDSPAVERALNRSKIYLLISWSLLYPEDEEFLDYLRCGEFVEDGRAALDALANRVSDSALKHRCQGLASILGFLGVSGVRPSRSQVAQDQIGRHEADDRFMVALARFVFDLVLPSEQGGTTPLTRIERDAITVRRLFERAVANFLAIELAPNQEWKVSAGKWLYWQKEFETLGIATVLPQMKTDIILENTAQKRRIIIDTKFTGIFTSSKYREEVLKSGYIYQMYAYLRSQDGFGDALCDNAEGVLLHPAIGADVDESVRIQGHEIRFVTVDLALSSIAILERLRTLSNPRRG